MDQLLTVWHQFDKVPMETLSKAWFFHRVGRPRQRRAAEIQEHRKHTGASGNCFDLAVWLYEELAAAGIRCQAIGHDLWGPEAHVALLAYDEAEQPYLCDLGDMWLKPLPVRASGQFMAGFFPAAEVLLELTDEQIWITYRRPNGKLSQQSYQLNPVSFEQLLEAGRICQTQISAPLVEIRVGQDHWEMCDGECFFSTSSGLIPDPPQSDLASQVAHRTGMQATYVRECLEITARYKLDFA
jgi:hypothetical protein